MSKPVKKALVPVLRFPEFVDAGEWDEEKLADLISMITPPKKLLTTNYLAEGMYPIIDQSQNYICGWTNDNEAVINAPLPLIVFGDHTCALKLATEPFAQGADGIKILKINDLVETIFLYQFLQFNPLVMESYKRHFSVLKEKMISFPEKETGEQGKIADCLSSLDALIAAHTQKHDALKAHKKGLMQQLFPAEGETVPTLRFPEFRDAGEWEEAKLGQLGELVSGLTYSPGDVRDKGLLVLRSSNVQNGEVSLADNVYVTPDIRGANLSKPNDILICVRNGSKALIGKNALIPEGMPLCTHGAFMTVFRSPSAKFVFQLFQSSAYQSQVDADLGATINSINGSHFIKYEFNVPHPPEQQKIADFLSSIDELITAQAQKIESLKTHKKGLMQQLFPATDGDCMDTKAEADA
jgi:type I restriction enzyme S subunit